MDQGFIKCFNNYDQTIERGGRSSREGEPYSSTKRRREDKKESLHFDQEQLKGLSAMGQHLMDRTSDMIEAKMAKGFYSNDSLSAFEPKPPTGVPPVEIKAYKGVFKRLDLAKDAAPAAKKSRFINQIGKHE